LWGVDEKSIPAHWRAKQLVTSPTPLIYFTALLA
jgi:hypothetical protein